MVANFVKENIVVETVPQFGVGGFNCRTSYILVDLQFAFFIGLEAARKGVAELPISGRFFRTDFSPAGIQRGLACQSLADCSIDRFQYPGIHTKFFGNSLEQSDILTCVTDHLFSQPCCDYDVQSGFAFCYHLAQLGIRPLHVDFIDAAAQVAVIVRE